MHAVSATSTTGTYVPALYLKPFLRSVKQHLCWHHWYPVADIELWSWVGVGCGRNCIFSIPLSLFVTGASAFAPARLNHHRARYRSRRLGVSSRRPPWLDLFGCGFRPRWIRRGPRDNAELSRCQDSARLRRYTCVLGLLVMEGRIIESSWVARILALSSVIWTRTAPSRRSSSKFRLRLLVFSRPTAPSRDGLIPMKSRAPREISSRTATLVTLVSTP
jgi:hypothetical protein